VELFSTSFNTKLPQQEEMAMSKWIIVASVFVLSACSANMIPVKPIPGNGEPRPGTCDFDPMFCKPGEHPRFQ